MELACPVDSPEIQNHFYCRRKSKKFMMVNFGLLFTVWISAFLAFKLPGHFGLIFIALLRRVRFELLQQFLTQSITKSISPLRSSWNSFRAGKLNFQNSFVSFKFGKHKKLKLSYKHDHHNHNAGNGLWRARLLRWNDDSVSRRTRSQLATDTANWLTKAVSNVCLPFLKFKLFNLF